jgi:hypothetical protein
VLVAVLVAVDVAVLVAVDVAVLVAVDVAVDVAVAVAVDVCIEASSPWRKRPGLKLLRSAAGLAGSV